jgi:hypothetical protein
VSSKDGNRVIIFIRSSHLDRRCAVVKVHVQFMVLVMFLSSPVIFDMHAGKTLFGIVEENGGGDVFAILKPGPSVNVPKGLTHRIHFE